MAPKRKVTPPEDIRSAIERHDDALARVTLYRDSVRHGWLRRFSVMTLIRAIIAAVVAIVVLVYFWDLVKGLLGW